MSLSVTSHKQLEKPSRKRLEEVCDTITKMSSEGLLEAADIVLQMVQAGTVHVADSESWLQQLADATNNRDQPDRQEVCRLLAQALRYENFDHSPSKDPSSGGRTKSRTPEEQKHELTIRHIDTDTYPNCHQIFRIWQLQQQDLELFNQLIEIVAWVKQNKRPLSSFFEFAPPETYQKLGELLHTADLVQNPKDVSKEFLEKQENGEYGKLTKAVIDAFDFNRIAIDASFRDVVHRLKHWYDMRCVYNRLGEELDQVLLVAQFKEQVAGVIWVFRSFDPKTALMIGIQSMIPYFFASRIRRKLKMSGLPSVANALIEEAKKVALSMGADRLATLPLKTMITTLTNAGFSPTDDKDEKQLENLKIKGLGGELVGPYQGKNPENKPHWYVHKLKFAVRRPRRPRPDDFSENDNPSPTEDTEKRPRLDNKSASESSASSVSSG